MVPPPDGSPGRLERLVDRFGNPFEWTYAARALLIIGTTVPFQLAYIVVEHHRTDALGIPSNLVALRDWVDWTRVFVWVPLLLLGIRLRARAPWNKAFLSFTCLYWYLSIGLSAWLYAPIASPLWTSIVGVTLVFLVLADGWVVFAGLLLLVFLTEAPGLISRNPFVYAPLYGASTQLTAALEYNVPYRILQLLIFILIVFICIFLVIRWRKRERSLAAAMGQLERTGEALERRVGERTAALRESEEKWRSVMENAPDNVMLVTRDGTIEFINRVLPQFTVEKVIGTTVHDYVPDSDKDKQRRALHNVFNRGTTERIELHFVDEAGQMHYYESRLAPVRRDGEIHRAVIIASEVTDRVRAEQARRAVEEKMREAQKYESLGVMAGGIAHDFNNMLMSILGNAHLLRQDPILQEDVQAGLRAIETAAVRAAELTQQLLAYAGRGAVVVSTIAVNDLISEMVELLRVSINKNASLELMLAETPLYVAADGSQIRQIVMNLVLNASEAIGKNPGTIRVRSFERTCDAERIGSLRVPGAMKPGPYVALEVRDSGTGMSETTLARVFDPFFSTKFTGRGLGLAAVLGIVRAHGGGLHIDSRVGEGTVFEVYLPKSDGPCRSAVAGVKRTDAGKRSRSGTVLVVDDEPPVRQITQQLLLRLGFDILAAESGEQALERIAQLSRPPALIVLDMTMPGWDGPRTLRALRESGCKEIPVVVMTGYTEGDVSTRFGEYPPSSYIQKPFTLERLEAAIDRAFGEQ